MKIILSVLSALVLTFAAAAQTSVTNTYQLPSGQWVQEVTTSSSTVTSIAAPPPLVVAAPQPQTQQWLPALPKAQVHAAPPQQPQYYTAAPQRVGRRRLQEAKSTQYDLTLFGGGRKSVGQALLSPIGVGKTVYE